VFCDDFQVEGSSIGIKIIFILSYSVMLLPLQSVSTYVRHHHVLLVSKRNMYRIRTAELPQFSCFMCVCVCCILDYGLFLFYLFLRPNISFSNKYGSLSSNIDVSFVIAL